MPIPASIVAELIWTPIAPPQNSSTTLPAEAPSEMPYIGIPLIPVEQMTLPLPVVPPVVHGLLTVFPADSGLPPLFTVYSRSHSKAEKLKAGTPEYKADSWKRYQERKGLKEYEAWSKKY